MSDAGIDTRATATGGGMAMGAPADADAVRAALRTVLDPETGRDIVAMGMVYAVTVQGGVAHVRFTTTVRGCPLSAFLVQAVEAAAASAPGIHRAEVDLTYDPPWSPERMEPLFA